MPLFHTLSHNVSIAKPRFPTGLSCLHFCCDKPNKSGCALSFDPSLLGVRRWIPEVWCASQSRWITQHGECLLAEFPPNSQGHQLHQVRVAVGSPGERSSRPRLALTPMALSSSSPQQRHITWMVWKPRMRSENMTVSPCITHMMVNHW